MSNLSKPKQPPATRNAPILFCIVPLIALSCGAPPVVTFTAAQGAHVNFYTEPGAAMTSSALDTLVTAELARIAAWGIYPAQDINARYARLDINIFPAGESLPTNEKDGSVYGETLCGQAAGRITMNLKQGDNADERLGEWTWETTALPHELIHVAQDCNARSPAPPAGVYYVYDHTDHENWCALGAWALLGPWTSSLCQVK